MWRRYLMRNVLHIFLYVTVMPSFEFNKKCWLNFKISFLQSGDALNKPQQFLTVGCNSMI